MTTTHKEIAHKKRENPTEPEYLLWKEICGLNTAARFTRKKYRYGVLCDFYCAGLNLAILIDDPHGRKEQRKDLRRESDVALLESKGLAVLVVPAETIFAAPGAVKVGITKSVYKILINQVREPVMRIHGVKSVNLIDDYKIEVERSEPGTDEILREIYHTIGSKAPGAQVFIRQEEAAAVVDTQGAQEVSVASEIVTEI